MTSSLEIGARVSWIQMHLLREVIGTLAFLLNLTIDCLYLWLWLHTRHLPSAVCALLFVAQHCFRYVPHRLPVLPFNLSSAGCIAVHSFGSMSGRLGSNTAGRKSSGSSGGGEGGGVTGRNNAGPAERMAAKAAKTAMDAVPKVYFEKDFTLTKRETFNAVFPIQVLEKGGGQGAAISSLEDELSTHLDTVEMELSTRLTHRSDLFFRAVDKQQALNSELEYMLASIHAMRARYVHPTLVVQHYILLEDAGGSTVTPSA